MKVVEPLGQPCPLRWDTTSQTRNLLSLLNLDPDHVAGVRKTPSLESASEGGAYNARRKGKEAASSIRLIGLSKSGRSTIDRYKTIRKTYLQSLCSLRRRTDS